MVIANLGGPGVELVDQTIKTAWCFSRPKGKRWQFLWTDASDRFRLLCPADGSHERSWLCKAGPGLPGDLQDGSSRAFLKIEPVAGFQIPGRVCWRMTKDRWKSDRRASQCSMAPISGESQPSTRQEEPP